MVEKRLTKMIPNTIDLKITKVKKQKNNILVASHKKV